MKTNSRAGKGTGMKPKSFSSQRKGKSMAKAAKTPKIAPEAPMVGIEDSVVR